MAKLRSAKWNGPRNSSTSHSPRETAAGESRSGYRTPRSPIQKRIYTVKTLKDLALFYVSRRETSRPRLQTYLQRKVNLEAQPEAHAWIEEILTEFERTNIINHARYADIIAREYARRGKGKRYIEQKLSEKGVGEQSKEIDFNTEDELSRAIELATKTAEKSTIRKIEDRFARKQRLLQKLVAAGFDYSIAKKAVEVALK